MALTRAPNNLPHFDRKDWDENSGMGGLLFVGEMGQMEVGVDKGDLHHLMWLYQWRWSTHISQSQEEIL